MSFICYDNNNNNNNNILIIIIIIINNNNNNNNNNSNNIILITTTNLIKWLVKFVLMTNGQWTLKTMYKVQLIQNQSLVN